MGLLWENLVPQQPVIGAWGSSYSSGEVMESSLAGFRRNSDNFTTRLSESPPTQPLKWRQSPKQLIFSCWAGPGGMPLPWAEAILREGSVEQGGRARGAGVSLAVTDAAGRELGAAHSP